MRYRLKSTASFERGFRPLEVDLKRRIDSEIRRLQENPYFGKPLHGDLKGKRSLRIGDCRIVYRIDEAEKIVLLLMVGHRKKVYES